MKPDRDVLKLWFCASLEAQLFCFYYLITLKYGFALYMITRFLLHISNRQAHS